MTEGRKEVARTVGLTKSDSQAYYERGLIAFGKNNFDDAITDISEAIFYDQGRAELYAARGFVFIQWAKEKKLAAKLEAAIVDLTYALKLNKREWLAHLSLGMIDFENGQWSDALKHFNDAKESSPGRPEPWFYRAICQYKMGKTSLAEDDMTLALRWMKDSDPRRKDAERWMKEFEK
jgi:tetratricopeptide (TPR) repeat protein